MNVPDGLDDASRENSEAVNCMLLLLASCGTGWSGHEIGNEQLLDLELK